MPYGCNPFCFTRYLYHTTYSGERKENLKKTVLFSAAWQHYKSPFQNFFTWYTAQPQFSHPHNFYPAHGTRASSEKKSGQFLFPFFQKCIGEVWFSPKQELFRRQFQKRGTKENGIWFFSVPCARCFLSVLRFPSPPPECLQKNKSVLSAWNFPMCYNAFWKYRTACAVCQVKCISIKSF